MPILDRRTNQFVEDQDTRVSDENDFPFALVPNQDGYFKSTKSTIDAIKISKVVALANKETIICGWKILSRLIKTI